MPGIMKNACFVVYECLRAKPYDATHGAEHYNWSFYHCHVACDVAVLDKKRRNCKLTIEITVATVILQ